ncbi:DUF4861 domain-containing protein [Chitinophaga sp. SYP-B3965]|uniref:DUF4861 family protein n=1 Tax=Chitinophaga sp. SYP-B3965 TaxID=2663120 RepID=UPI00129975A2|nr:DUF4861 family protein [Chitinophaga sp. SYP-B3965]MRG47375.1 DUF4861 domain-containing protein [Chitinophaga sp. SYP-B3965]
MKLFTSLCLSISMAFTSYAQERVVVALSNPAASASDLVELDYAQVAASLGKGTFKIINAANGKEIAYQLIFEGNKVPVKILLGTPVAARSKISITFVKGTPAPVNKKTFGRYVPERKDDFAWENDRVAFRMYGKALEATPKENAYGVDVWNKRTEKLIVNSWYKRGNYHKDEGEGLDYYHVGYTLGAGGIAPYKKDSIWFPKNYTSSKVLDSGPLRTTFELSYDAWQVDGVTINVTKTISLDAGAQLSKMQIRFTDSVPVAIGIIKRNEPGTMLLEEAEGVMGYWEPVHGKDGTTGVGCVILNPVKEMAVAKGHLLAVSATDKNNTVTYYTGAAWDKAGRITNAGQWFRYLQEQSERLKDPVKISFTR